MGFGCMHATCPSKTITLLEQKSQRLDAEHQPTYSVCLEGGGGGGGGVPAGANAPLKFKNYF